MKYNTFVYKWTDMNTGMYYIGVHKGTFDDGYISSSKVMLKEYRSRPTEFIREIIAYGSDIEMRNLEKKILLELDAAGDQLSYNKWNSHSKLYNVGPMSEEHKSKISNALKGNKNSKGVIRNDEFKQKLSENKKGNKNFLGKKHNPETKKKMSMKQKGKILTEDHLNNIRNAQKNRRQQEQQSRIEKLRGHR